MPNMGMAGMGAGGYGKAGGRGNEPSCNLFVTGLPMEIDEGQLRDLFANYGMVMRCKVLPHNGMPDRAALVEMGDVAQSQWIVNNLNGNTPAGMSGPIKIGYSQSKGKGSRQSPYEQPAPGNLSGLEIKLATHTNDLGNKLWVGQIPLGTTKDLMYHEFSKYGAVQDVYIRDDGKVQGRMWGFVTFVDSTGATEVLSAFATGAFAQQAMGAAQDQFQMPPPPMPEPPQPLSVRPRADNPCKLWVGGIPAGSTEMFLREEFGKVGQARPSRKGQHGRPKTWDCLQVRRRKDGACDGSMQSP
ncbi:PAB1 [Symbiodinium sp. CCMP2456]|nr:PAB1 [Symbiodinium sp. CCMP2456]